MKKEIVPILAVIVCILIALVSWKSTLKGQVVINLSEENMSDFGECIGIEQGTCNPTADIKGSVLFPVAGKQAAEAAAKPCFDKHEEDIINTKIYLNKPKHIFTPDCDKEPTSKQCVQWQTIDVPIVVNGISTTIPITVCKDYTYVYNCTWEFVGVKSNCCGNGKIEAKEQCDVNAKYNGLASSYCTSTCKKRYCGDGTTDSEYGDGDSRNEECDDGKTCDNGFGKFVSCESNETPICAGANSTCATRDNDGCSSSCKWEFCGDGVQQVDEDCEDGNNDDNDGCSSYCKVEYCGDSIHQPNEECDDGYSCISKTTGAWVECTYGVSDCVDKNSCGQQEGDGCNNACELETQFIPMPGALPPSTPGMPGMPSMISPPSFGTPATPGTMPGM